MDENNINDVNNIETDKHIDEEQKTAMTPRESRRLKFAKIKHIKLAKASENSARNFRLAIVFVCVILATSILTSAVSYQIFNFYNEKRNESLGISDTLSLGSSSQDISDGTNSETGGLTVAQINRKVLPSVVYIGVTYETENIFGGTQQGDGSGSGIIISADGYILTNNHVINNAIKVSVKLSTGDTYEADIIGADPQTDLAIIKIDESNLAAAELGDSSLVEVGDLAIAIGFPLGTLDPTLTAGVISALNRSITINDFPMSLIQHDAAVNPGNSGGALVNDDGQVVGVVNAKTSAVGIEGLGYAIPINEAKLIATDLINQGYVGGRIKLGITGKDITSDLAEYYDLPIGVYVVEVAPGSSADKAGIMAEDVIIEIDQQPIKTSADLTAVRDSHEAGDSIKILLIRDKKEKVVILVFEEYKP